MRAAGSAAAGLLRAQQRRGQQENKQEAGADTHCFIQVSVDMPTGMQPVVEVQSLTTESILPSADSVAFEVANSLPIHPDNGAPRDWRRPRVIAMVSPLGLPSTRTASSLPSSLVSISITMISFPATIL